LNSPDLVAYETGETIAIVGAGLIGLSIAYELARRGATVRVFEAREPARAASWAGAGMLAPYTEAPASEVFDAFCEDSLARYPAFAAGLSERGGVDAHLRLDGILEIAFDAETRVRLRDRVAGLRERGVAARYLERDEARSLEPVLGATCRGVALCEPEGTIDNRRLGRALLGACRSLGVRLDEQTGDVALEADERRVLGVRSKLGFIPARAVVNASGAWAGALTGVPERAHIPVTPVKGQMLALAMPRRFVRRTLWVPGAYLVPRDDGRLLVGATVEPAGFDTRVTAQGMHALLDAALAALPALRDLTVAETWAGLRPGTPDGLPFIGETNLAGYFVASGHYRNGILLAPATAALVADLLEGKPGIPAFSPLRVHGAQSAVAKDVP
jgi:glycine oxidase